MENFQNSAAFPQGCCAITTASACCIRPVSYTHLINIVLDLVLVGIFHFGVGAAAFATIISQFVSAFLCLRRLMRSPEEYRVCLKKIRFDTALLRQIIANGLPAGFQNSVISLANVVVQSNINRFGKMAMAGCGAYSKIEGFEMCIRDRL